MVGLMLVIRAFYRFPHSFFLWETPVDLSMWMYLPIPIAASYGLYKRKQPQPIIAYNLLFTPLGTWDFAWDGMLSISLKGPLVSKEGKQFAQ